jgi:hypothetical protein
MSDAGYSGKPLAAKLGLKPVGRMVALDAPPAYAALLDPLPHGASLILGSWPDEALAASADIVHAFVTDRAALQNRAEALGRAPRIGAAVWISWPKKSSPLYRDLTEDGVRELMLPTGWVDVKVAAVDRDWSALKFLRRRR